MMRIRILNVAFEMIEKVETKCDITYLLGENPKCSKEDLCGEHEPYVCINQQKNKEDLYQLCC